MRAHTSESIGTLDGRLDSRSLASAAISPSGTRVHSPADESVIDARDELRRALLAFDEARTRNKRAGAHRWQPLVGSNWSLLDEFEADGRRFVVVIESARPLRARRRDLSQREQQVLTRAQLGYSDKVIAHELGLSHSTVRVLLHRAAKKLGAATRHETLARFAALTKASHSR